MSSAFQRGDSPARADVPGAADRETAPSKDAALGSQMLDQILSLTKGNAPPAGFIEREDVAALFGVARRLAGQPFVLEPVAIELIQAVVQVQFQKAGLADEQVRAMARQIATTLCDDPPSRARLEALWAALLESST